ncbi:MAG TPA: glycosyltransferase family 2 protein [bacterium]|nr:glycosyltransferase family 2 protein [bacterium]
MTNGPVKNSRGAPALVVVNFRQERYLPALYESVLRQSLSPSASILVNNSRSDFAAPSGVEVIESEKNRGFGAAANLGIRRATDLGAGSVFVLNADVILDSLCLERLSLCPGGIVQPLILLADRPGRINAAGLRPTRLGVARCMKYMRGSAAAGIGPSPIPAASGAAMLIRREAVDLAGFFDEEFFLYLEDVDFSLRVRRAGLAVMLEPRAVVWHHYRLGLRLPKLLHLWRNARRVRKRFSAEELTFSPRG